MKKIYILIDYELNPVYYISDKFYKSKEDLENELWNLWESGDLDTIIEVEIHEVHDTLKEIS